MIRWIGAHDLSLIAVVAVAAAAAWGFTGVADAVMEEESHAVDREIVLALRDTADATNPIGPPWFEEAARDVTALGGVAVLTMATIAVLGYVLLHRAYRTAIVTA